MTRLIDADALLEFIHNNFKAEWDYPSVEDVTEIITNAPTIQREEHDELAIKAVKDALEKAASICERDYIRFKETEKAHYRLSPKPFNFRDFGFNMNDVNRAFHTALEIRALIKE